MDYYVAEYQIVEGTAKTAGTKARDDVGNILNSLNIKQITIPANMTDRESLPKFEKIKFHIDVLRKWGEALSVLKKGDRVIIQFPNIEHSVFLPLLFGRLKSKGIKIIFLIHDLELLRRGKRTDVSFSSKLRTRLEENNALRAGEKIIVHNRKMLQYMIQLGFPAEKLINLRIFDYLIPDYDEKRMAQRKIDKNLPIIIAGNLRRHKAAYVYELDDTAEFNLFGIGYDGRNDDQIHYLGAREPDDLPYGMEGSFGLVWDGESTQTCSGAFGEYLRINNPHKVSLYLVSGIPVIIWDQAALASFIRHYNCGITVSSLSEIKERVSSMSEEEYRTMKKNAGRIGTRLRNGYYTKKALEKAEG